MAGAQRKRWHGLRVLRAEQPLPAETTTAYLHLRSQHEGSAASSPIRALCVLSGSASSSD